MSTFTLPTFTSVSLSITRALVRLKPDDQTRPRELMWVRRLAEVPDLEATPGPPGVVPSGSSN